jgi:hypothetical protein
MIVQQYAAVLQVEDRCGAVTLSPAVISIGIGVLFRTQTSTPGYSFYPEWRSCSASCVLSPQFLPEFASECL